MVFNGAVKCEMEPNGTIYGTLLYPLKYPIDIEVRMCTSQLPYENISHRESGTIFFLDTPSWLSSAEVRRYMECRYETSHGAFNGP